MEKMIKMITRLVWAAFALVFLVLAYDAFFNEVQSTVRWGKLTMAAIIFAGISIIAYNIVSSKKDN